MRHAFSNNAVTTLAAGISDTAEEITLTNDSAFEAGLFGPELIQPLTISSADGVQPPEIVYAYSRPSANVRNVYRGMEGTAAAAWLAGSVVSARVTAGMLQKFPQIDDGAMLLGAFEGRNWINAAQISGYPAIQLARASTSLETAYMDANLSREVVGAHAPVNLGSVSTWTSGASYSPFSIVAPPTLDGYQYHFDPIAPSSVSQTTTVPAFNSTPGMEAPAIDALDEVVGSWMPTNVSAMNQIAPFPGVCRLVVTEIGFVCTVHGGGSAPVVSFGADANATLFASSLSLSQISAAGHVHRIPVTAGGATVAEKLTMNLVTPSSANFVGRWYWKGFFIQTALPV